MRTQLSALLTSSLLLAPLLTIAQTSEILFQRVAPMAEFSLSELQTYTQHYFQNEEYSAVVNPVLIANPDSTSFRFPRQFMLYNHSTLRHPVGLVTYRATVDLEEKQIRYSADSIFFQSYSRNRYSRYVPDNIPPVSFERWQPTWQEKQSEDFNAQIETVLEAHFQEIIDVLEQKKSH